MMQDQHETCPVAFSAHTLYTKSHSNPSYSSRN